MKNATKDAHVDFSHSPQLHLTRKMNKTKL